MSIVQREAPVKKGKLNIKAISMSNFRGYERSNFQFDKFNLLIGQNGTGKTTVIEAVNTLCSSFDYEGERLKAVLRKNIRNIDDDKNSKSFSLSGVFEYEENGVKEDFVVLLNQDGWVKNEIVQQDFWWPGISYITKFDSNMTDFQLDSELWESFAMAWQSITGHGAINPEEYEAVSGAYRVKVIVGFTMDKNGNKTHCRKGSAGEKKVMKMLSQIVSIEKSRQPDIVLIDNIEMHIHSSRHLKVIEEIKRIFAGKQIIGTTHSEVIIREYPNQNEILKTEQ